MNIVLANKFYYPRGGDCIYTIALENLLRSHGNDVAIFSMQHPSNLRNRYDSYWPSALEYSKKDIRRIRESVARPIYSGEVKQKFTRLLKDFRPDIVHLGNIHSQLSPLIARVAFEHHIPVVWTLHDFKLVCPSYSCLRDGKICELCFTKKINVVRYKCIKQSIIGSTIAYLEALKWNRRLLQRITNYFICPSEFLRRKMIEGGFDEQKLLVVNNFIAKNDDGIGTTDKQPYYCYVGRLSREKGIQTLLDVAAALPEYTVKIIGTGPLENELRQKYAKPNIEFLGHLDWATMKDIVSAASFSVLPSECSENFPMSVIESMTLGTTVIGSRIGGITEMIRDGSTGLLFTPGNTAELAVKIKLLFTDPALRARVSRAAHDHAVQRFDPEVHYRSMMEVYNRCRQ